MSAASMPDRVHRLFAAGLLLLLFFLAGGAAWRESATVDEIAHVGAGLSYVQRLDLRLNGEHPPLGKVLAAMPLAIRGTRADYSGTAWRMSADFFPAFAGQWVFGDAVLGRWNVWKSTLAWARFPMLLLTLGLGWILYCYGNRIGGRWGGLLCLAMYVTTPAFLVFGPLVLTDLPVTLFTVIALWQLGEIWAAPTAKHALFFGLAFGASLLSKFTGLLLFPVILALFVQTRIWPTAGQPKDKAQRKAWRRARWHCILCGVLWAALLVYVVYFLLSLNQSDEALSRIRLGHWSNWGWVIRRPLMPLWLYLRGVLFTLVMGSRATYLFGHTYAHGVPFYFPVVFALKSTLGFLLLLVFAGGAAVFYRKSGGRAIPAEVRPHWRVLLIGFFVFVAVCLASQLDISIRHFMVPIALLILMLAPLPRMLDTFPQPRFWKAAAIVLTASCFVPILLAYPYFFPFVNSVALGRPVYYLLNDSNVSWNEGLPAVERFVEQEHLNEIRLDWASASDPALVVPNARAWDCQQPSERDAGLWVVVAAVSILENRNCGYLRQYPQRPLAGGSFYAFKLPAVLPPPPAERKLMWGLPVDLRSWALNVERHPEQLPAETKALLQNFQREAAKK